MHPNARKLLPRILALIDAAREAGQQSIELDIDSHDQATADDLNRATLAECSARTELKRRRFTRRPFLRIRWS